MSEGYRKGLMSAEREDLYVKNSFWKDGILGVVTGDALGCPVQFLSREEIAANPVTTMTGHGTYDMPVGTWTDDSSLTLATLVSIQGNGSLNPADIMFRFALWLTEGEYTPFGEAFDNGLMTTEAITRYMKERDIGTCGGRMEYDNGNGSLMRILPVCLYCYEQQNKGEMTDEEAVYAIHQVSGLTHNHMRAKIACGLYYFMIRAILRGKQDVRGADADLIGALQQGIDEGAAFYRRNLSCAAELSHYGRLLDLYAFRDVPSSGIRSTGYVVDTLEAAVWSLLKTNTFGDALLTAVNLGDDTDTVGAVCGGLAGLFYGCEDIPGEWLRVIRRRGWIERLCEMQAEGKAVQHLSRFERRERNVRIFRDTSDACKESARLSESIRETTRQRKLIPEGDVLPEVRKDPYAVPASVILSGKRSFEAARAYAGKKTCVLNFASAVNPGGGVKNGSSAQEEALCRCSTLYFALDTPRMMTRFYLPHREAGNALNNDDIIYTPKITVFKSDTDAPERLPEEAWYETDVLTCAAPNLRDYEKKDGRGIDGEQLRKLLEKRIRRIFEVAALEENEVLILGAFGCGAFRNPPDVVAEVFRQMTEEFRYAFETIEYAVYCADYETGNYEAFERALAFLTKEA